MKNISTKLCLLGSLAFFHSVQATQMMVTTKQGEPSPQATNTHTIVELKKAKDPKAVQRIGSYHVSCHSDTPASLYGEDNLGGVVLYLYDGQEDWYLNKIHCKTGYILLKKTTSIKPKQANRDAWVHAHVYKSVFKQAVDNKVVGSGFVYVNLEKENKREWRFDSLALHTESDQYHQSQRRMNRLEERWVMQAIKNWITTGQQNTQVTDEIALTTTSNLKN